MSRKCQAGSEPSIGNLTGCKETCESDNCNNSKVVKPKKCFNCQSTRLSDNSTVGFGDINCWNITDTMTTVECDEACITEIEIDWLPRGMQQATIKRGCAQSWTESGTCTEQVVDDFNYKDCTMLCEYSYCNADLDEVARLFSSESPQARAENFIFL